MVGLFVWGRWRYDAVSLGILALFVLLGYIEPDKAFLGFSHPAVITVALVLLISKGLEKSGFISILGRKLQTFANSEIQFLISITFIAALLSSFMNNISNGNAFTYNIRYLSENELECFKIFNSSFLCVYFRRYEY